MSLIYIYIGHPSLRALGAIEEVGQCIADSDISNWRRIRRGIVSNGNGDKVPSLAITAVTDTTTTEKREAVAGLLQLCQYVRRRDKKKRFAIERRAKPIVRPKVVHVTRARRTQR